MPASQLAAPASDRARDSTLTEGIFESGIWTAEPDLNSAFTSGKWFSDEKIYCPGKTVPPSPEEKIVVTEYELRNNWLANDSYHSAASSMYGHPQQHSPGVGRAEPSENAVQGNRSSSTWRWTLGKHSPSDSMRGDGGFSPGTAAGGGTSTASGAAAGAAGGGTGGGTGVSLGRSSKPSPENYAAGDSRGFFRDSKNEGASSRRHGQEVFELPAAKGTKTRLNLLNPMALLARRRSAQPVSSRPEDSISISKLTVPALPDDYDPRIRGSLVHDFSRPRGRPNMGDGNGNSYISDRTDRSRQPRELPDNPPRWSIQHQHQHQQQYHYQPPVIAPQPTTYRQINNTSVELPPKTHSHSHTLTHIDPPETINHEKQGRRLSDIPASHSSSPQSTLRYKPPSVRDPSFTPLGLPRHLTSSASRFSFDLAGGASSSQEKLMEEKHKAKEAAKRAQGFERKSEFDADSDEFDYDEMMDDDGLEEKIPGVNADAESGEEENDGDMAIGGLRLPLKPPRNTAYIPTLPPTAPSPISPNSLSQQSPAMDQQYQSSLLPSPPINYQFDASARQSIPPLYPSEASIPAAAVSPELPTSLRTSPNAPRSKPDKDDMYFDDGRFGELPADMKDPNFDESIFDDESSYLYDRKRCAAQPPPNGPTMNRGLQHYASMNTSQAQGSIIEQSIAPAHPRTQSQFQSQFPDNPQSQDLTKGNLEAYHSALAQAANDAARKGRFERRSSLSETSLPEGTSQTDPCLTADESRMSQTADTTVIEQSLYDFDYDDDEALEDDAIIAEANADVLENDDEGFYGREFGFYAQSNGSDSTERLYGGYFGARGAEGVIRNHSGQKNLREPSLTPITERSEWSTRNSIVSLATHVGHTTQPSNPPLAQLVGMEGPDDDISFNALMKLRRGAWGGSNGSLRSNALSQGTASPSATHQSSSTHGISSFFDAGSPVQTNGMFSGTPEMNSPIQHNKDYVSTDARFRSYLTSDRRHSESIQSPPIWDATNRNPLRALEDDRPSAAISNVAGDRISYVRSVDESGMQYWVLERRRTDGTGESELLERETMRVGRI